MVKSNKGKTNLKLILNEKSPQPLRCRTIGFTPSGEWKWLDNRQEDTTGSSSGARHCRSNQHLTECQTIRQPQSALPHPLHKVSSNPIPQPCLHKPTSKEERDHDQPNHLVREGAERRRERQSFRHDGGRQAQKSPRPYRQRTQDQTRDCRHENREQLPCLRSDFHWFGN